MYGKLFHSEAAAPTRASIVSLILRVTLAVIFLVHGLDKIVQHDGGTTWVNAMYGRMPARPSDKPEDQRAQVDLLPESMTFLGTQVVVAWGELLAGLALLLGMLTRLASVGLIVIQVGAVVLVTAPRGFVLERGGGYEYNVALIAMCLGLVVLGAGKWSVDALLLKQRRKAAQSRAQPAPLPVSGPHVIPQEAAERLPSEAAS